jgi:quercetin dioxygenase-like cupin family protein
MNDLTKTKIPELKVSKRGKSYKVFEVTGDEGALMPPHLSTKEAVVIVQEGEAELSIENSNSYFTKNDVFIIPAGTVHSLSIKKKFKSIVIMQLDSEIEFVN